LNLLANAKAGTPVRSGGVGTDFCISSAHGRPRRSTSRVRPKAGSQICFPLQVLVAIMLWAQPCQAQGWNITPSVSLYESFTSNANLNPIGQGDPDFFTTLVPAIGISGDTARLKLNLNYSLAAIAYAQNSDLDQVRNNLNFDSTLTLVPDLLFVDGVASIAQVPSNGGIPVSSSPLAASTNEDTVGAYIFSPYVKNHFGTFADSEFRYTFNQVIPISSSGADSGANQLTTATSNRLTGTLVSGAEFSQLLWSVVADGDSTTFAGGNPDTSSRLLQANGEYRLDRQVGLLASVGYEQISDPTFSPSPEPDGPIGSIGIKFTPSPRTSIVLNLNHRYNSDFVTGSGSYLLDPQSQLRAIYTDQVFTSSQALFATNLSFLTTDEFGNFIDSRTEQLFSLANTSFGVQTDAFRQRNLGLGFHTVRGRNTFDVGAYWQDRNVFQTGETDTAFGGAVGWGRALTPVTNVSLGARYADEQFDVPMGQSDHLQLVGVGGSLVYHLNETVDGVLTLNYTRQFSDLPGNSYEETVLSAGLQKRF
jgi:uncharacterized protein (PEP-CTERM system associated)